MAQKQGNRALKEYNLGMGKVRYRAKGLYDHIYRKRDERRAAGLCIVCGGPKDREGWHCSSCLKKMNALKRNNVIKRKAAGICANCGKPTNDGGWCCPDCQKKNNAHAKERGLWRRAHGLCPQCGQPADDGYIYCQRCRDIHNEYQRCKKYGIPWENNKRGQFAD